MAVHDKGNTPKTPSSYAKAEGSTPQPEQGQPVNSGYSSGAAHPLPNQGKSGLGSINQVLQRSGSSERSETRSAEAILGLREASKEAIEQSQLSDHHNILRFDRDQNRVGLSAILLVKLAKTEGKTVACVRPLLLETSAVTLPPRKIPYGNNRIEIPTRPQDVYNDKYWERIVTFLKNDTGINDLAVVDAGPLVIPESFDFRDVFATKELLVTSVNRCDDAVAAITGEAPFNVTGLKKDDERLTARIDFTGVPTHDIVGNPIRSDMVVSMSRSSTAADAEDDYYQSETLLNSVSAFVNLEYTPPQQQTAYPQPGQQLQPFTPTVVITSVSNAPWVQANTPELYLFAITNAYRTTINTAWAKCFLPQLGIKGVDMRDVGALGYLVGGTPAPTKSDTFDDNAFVEFMTAMVRPNPSFLIDVNPVGENAAIENYLIDAAYDGPNRRAAIEKIVLAANNLTGNLFSEHFDHHQNPIVIPYGQEIHLGHYIGADGEVRDIRDADVLAMLNLTQGNLTEWEEWYRTLCDTAEPFEARMQKREQMERHYLSKSLKITGRAVRLMLSPAFIDALDAAATAAGVMVDMDNVSNIMGATRFQGNQMVDQYTVHGSARMGGYGNPNANRSHNYQAGVTQGGRYY